MNFSSRSINTSREIDETQRIGGLPSQLRTLPGYTSTYTPAPVSTPAPTPSVPPTTTRYQTRERLYYEADSVLPARTVKPASVVARLADDAPPAISLHEYGNLTPERKYASREEMPKEEIPAEPAVPSDGNWVTVFGFSGAQASSVLSYFQKLGVVEQSETGQGNWIHLQYSTRWAAQKALAKNGTVLPVMGTCMIGVVPTTRAMEQVGQAAESFMSPLKKESIRRTSQDQYQGGDIFIKPGMAPILRQEEDETRAREVTNPQESMVAKAFGFVFGWYVLEFEFRYVLEFEFRCVLELGVEIFESLRSAGIARHLVMLD
ncbi:Nucleoporin NUP53 [Paramicrosporidium saccamoebae]|uniref:Nucleoporin NUP53 n=1 Tax=Paramicrosporidium saccamoebae TaxID=1246581 RepID=A0A2H9TGB2_9FUNG|nr:Nucleoporin NUP53 [Paramicrosporidium saccamoebae]